MSNNVTDVQVKRDDERWEVEIKAQISSEALEHHRAEALKEMQKTVKLDGFRPGKTPIDRIITVYGESTVLKHAAEHAIQHELPELLAKESLMVIESPRVSIETPESGKPLPFTATAALAPKVELADYKAIAIKMNATKEEVTVSDEEYGNALTHLKRERARIEKMEKGTDAEKAGEESRAMEEKDLPELDDEFVKALGYENASVFSEKLRENIKKEKERQMHERIRTGILDEIANGSKISYPAVLREYELDDMEARIKDDLSRIGRSFEDYLAEVKKTKEGLRTEWKDAADKRAKTRLTLAEISRKENIDADSATLEKELERAKKSYPQAKPEILHTNLAHALKNEAVLKWLESK